MKRRHRCGAKLLQLRKEFLAGRGGSCWSRVVAQLHRVDVSVRKAQVQQKRSEVTLQRLRAHDVIVRDVTHSTGARVRVKVAVVEMHTGKCSVSDETCKLLEVKVAQLCEVEHASDGDAHLLARSVHSNARMEVLQVVECGQEAVEGMPHNEDSSERVELVSPRGRQREIGLNLESTVNATRVGARLLRLTQCKVDKNTRHRRAACFGNLQGAQSAGGDSDTTRT